MDKKSIWDLNRPSVEEYRHQKKTPLTVILDNVRSLNNIGSLFRTADAFAARRILLCGITACPPSAEIHKTALGAEDSVEWIHFPSTLEAMAWLRSKEPQVRICCLEQVKGSIPLQQFRPQTQGSYAIVCGHEVNGVDQAVVNASDVCIEIPQLGTKHSLNVTVSTAIAMWHFFDALTLQGQGHGGGEA